MKNLLNGILRRLGFDYDADSNSGWEERKEEKWSPAPKQEDDTHRDDRFTSVTTVEGDKEVACPNCGCLREYADIIVDGKCDHPHCNGIKADLKEGQIYVTLDGDDVGAEVEDSLMENETDTAKELSESILRAHEMLKIECEKIGGERVFTGGDNAFFIVPQEAAQAFAETARKIYSTETGHTITVGIGTQPIEAHKALVYGKNTGKDKVVEYNEEVEEEVQKIKQKQEELEETYDQLKYKASFEREAEEVAKENTAQRLLAVHQWAIRYQVEIDTHGQIVLYYAAPKTDAAAVAQNGLPKGTLLETTAESALFFTCDNNDISRTDVVLYAVHVPPFVLEPGKFGTLLDDLDSTFVTPVELPSEEEFKQTDVKKEKDDMSSKSSWLKSSTVKKVALELWTHPDNYMGESYEDYYVGPGRSRDSDSLEESNFESALKMLGGEGDGVVVARANHWAVGWVESILVQKDAADKVAILQQIENEIAKYPVLDEDDYTERQWKGYEADYHNWAKDEVLRAVDEHLGGIGVTDVELTPEMESKLFGTVMDHFANNGDESLGNIEDIVQDLEKNELVNDLREKLGLELERKFIPENPNQMKLPFEEGVL